MNLNWNRVSLSLYSNISLFILWKMIKSVSLTKLFLLSPNQLPTSFITLTTINIINFEKKIQKNSHKNK